MFGIIRKSRIIVIIKQIRAKEKSQKTTFKLRDWIKNGEKNDLYLY